MNKYIDSEKLIAEIKRYKNKADNRLKIQGRTFAEEQKDVALQNLCGNLLHFIASLQQEQPEVDLEKIEKASYKVFPVKKKLGAEIKYPNREDENFSKREIWKDGVIWAIYELWLNARK